MSTHPRPIISLIGPRCSGKTSVGERLAQILDINFIDLDSKLVDLHAKESGTVAPSAGAILELVGEKEFRQLEARALRQALAAKSSCVLATGGGVVELSAHRRLLRERTSCVRLVTRTDLLRKRLAKDPTPRPALIGADPVEEIEILVERREPHYAEASHFAIDCGDDPVELLAQRIQILLASAR